MTNSTQEQLNSILAGLRDEAAQINKQIMAVENTLNVLTGGAPTKSNRPAKNGKTNQRGWPKGKPMSEATKAKMRAAQQARWAAIRKTQAEKAKKAKARTKATVKA